MDAVKHRILMAITGVLALGALLGFMRVRDARAQTCGGAAFCNCPCNVLCEGATACSELRQVCENKFLCGDQMLQSSGCWTNPERGPYPTECATCLVCSSTYQFCECPSYVNPCINICGEAPTPTPTPTPLPLCGNNRCTDAGENCLTCWQDCGACPTATPIPSPGATPAPTEPPPASCGNGICNPGENCSICSSDCGSCPAPSCNPDLWGAWGSCSGSPATKSRTNGCGTTQTISCTGSINARAVVISSADQTCTATRASTSGVSGTVHQFTPGSASQPAPQTQTGASYVTFSGVNGGSYTISPTVASEYILTTACWSRLLNAPTSGEGFSAYLSVPTDGETLTWDLGYLLGTPWAQVDGGNVYAATTITSPIPPGASPRSFVRDGTGGYPGLVTYGSDYDFNPDPLLKGEGNVSTTDWLAQDSPSFQINWYEYFWRKLGGGTTPDSFPDLAAVAKPASRATPYYIVGDMTTSGDWVVGEGEMIIMIVNGNLTLGGKVNITGSGFAAFIVNGTITVSPSVGGLSTSSAPVIEGIFVTSPTGTFKTSTSSVPGKERLVGQGMFVAGSFLLQRDLDSVGANTTTPAELFLYNPKLLFTMPDSMRDVPITWQEVAP